MERLKEIDGPYFHNFPDCDNPYRDGYVTEPPKKPRASYLVFQCIMRPYFTKQNPNASLNELMTIIGDTWKSMSDMEQEPFLELARQEAKQYEKERALMERAQKPNEMWQPIRRCMKVLDRICEEGYSDIFKEPVDLNDFPDYEEIVETPMDLGTVRKKLKDKTYQMHEAFARDMRKVNFTAGSATYSDFLCIYVLLAMSQLYSPIFIASCATDLEQLQDLQQSRLANLACRRLHVQNV